MPGYPGFIRIAVPTFNYALPYSDLYCLYWEPDYKIVSLSATDGAFNSIINMQKLETMGSTIGVIGGVVHF